VVPVPLLREQTTSPREARRAHAPLSAARIAAIYDLHGRSAYSVAMMILADREHAEAATEDAFRSLRNDEKARGDAGQLRTHLLRLVYAAAKTRATARAPRAPLPALLTHAPLSEHQALVLCLHGVTCAALDASEGAPPGTAALRLHRALRQARSERSAHRRP
jgi:hypothetical protein